MNTKTCLIAAVAAALCLVDVHANDYYVDAVNGDDANDGLAAGEGRAKESFAALFSAYSIKSGDKVYAAAGIYTNGVMGTTSKYRLVVPAGVEIIGAGADVTTIEGQAHTNELGETTLDADPWGCGANAIRGVYLNKGAILRKFTLAKCYSENFTSGNGAGAYSSSLANCGYLIDCVITGCVGGRGAGSAYTTAVRCHFYGNRNGHTGSDIWAGSAFNCLFGNALTSNAYNLYQGGPYVNNTFYGSGTCAHASSGTITLYNSAILKGPSSNVSCSNSVTTSANITLYAGSTKIASVAAAKLDANYRPLRDSPCIDVASWDFYTNRFPSAIIDEATKDFLGNPRIVGAALDAGACESLFATGVPFDWHVDAVNGSDANDGTSAGTAFQNLSMALTNSYLRSGDTVHAASGMYTNGVITSGNNRKYRAVVPVGVTLVGDAGAEQTVIVGAPDPGVALDASPYGCGSNAVQCVRLLHSDSSTVGATIRGFTLTGGRNVSYTTSSVYGGAVYCGDDRSNLRSSGVLIDCIVTNNCSTRGAGVAGARSLRCRFADNRAAETGCDVYTSMAYNCFFGDLANPNTYNFYGTASSRCINCTFAGTGYAGAMSAVGCGFYNCLVLKDLAMRMIMTNCVYTGILGNQGSAGNSTKVDSVEDVHLDASYRPLRNSPALDKGDAAYYTLPAALADEAGYDFLKAVRVQGLGIDVGAFESSESSAGTNWYVNATTGSDASDGATEATAFKTLAAAMTNEWLIANDIVNVAAGTYSDGEMTTASSRKYRVVVPAGVTLLGAGADKTIIEGAEDRENGTEAGHWCGPNALACVKLYAGSIVRGVTLTKGHTPAWEASSTENWGGAVQASGVAAYVVDCVISNNFAGRGAGLYGGTAVRCRFNGNGVRSTGTDIMQGSAYNCIFGDLVDASQDSVYQGQQYVNCVFYGSGNVSHNNSGTVTNIWNSIVLRKYPGTGVRLVNCAMIASSGYSYGDTSVTLTQTEMMLDENYAPRKGSPLIDRGRNDLYAKFPAAVAEALAKTDLAGSQRVYNGTIDIGAYEYDWRGGFAKTLRVSRVSVVSAGEGVTNAVGFVSVPAGETLSCEWSINATADCSFMVRSVDGGTAVVLIDGEPVMPDGDGKYTFSGAAGSTVGITISCTGDGSVKASSFRSGAGICVIVM